jgi:hypothetical protein
MIYLLFSVASSSSFFFSYFNLKYIHSILFHIVGWFKSDFFFSIYFKNSKMKNWFYIVIFVKLYNLKINPIYIINRYEEYLFITI